jgi:predicted PurR-regulated permease PerM
MAESRAPSLLTILAVSAALAYALQRFQHALTPFLLAAAFAYVLNPAVVYFEARGWKRSALVVGGYLAALALCWGAYAGLKPLILDQVESLQTRAPLYARQFQKTLESQQAVLTKRLPMPPAVAEKVLEKAVGGAIEKVQAVPTRLLSLIPLMAHLLLVPFIGFFFLLDASDGVDGLIQACPSRFVEQGLHLLSEIDTALGNYLRGILIVAAAIAGASFLGLLAMGVDNALLIALISGVSSFVPYLGAVMGIVVGGAMAFYQFGTVAAVAKVALLFVGIRLADEIFLQPVIAKHSVHLHPMVFLLALVLGGDMFGFLGLVFAVPAACIAKALVKVAWSWYSSERWVSADAPARAEIPLT